MTQPHLHCDLVSVPCFPADWKTAELPLRETFQPCIAAIISPSLFYVLSPIQGQTTLSCACIFQKCQIGTF